MSDDGFRIERDTMGEVRVPVSARWGAQTQRAVENFPVSGVTLEPALIRASARTSEGSNAVPDTGKFSTARWLCAPHRAEAGTLTSPIVSCSMRKPSSLTPATLPTPSSCATGTRTST